MPVRFQHADDTAIRLEFTRHRPVLETRDETKGESTILCSCGLSVTMPKQESAVLGFAEHFLAALKGSAA